MSAVGHSPLGASGASRWMKCPGSVGLSYGVVDEESEHAILGTAAHNLGEICLGRDHDAWTFMGEDALPGTPVDKDMADAVQVYLDAIRQAHPNRNQGNFWVERRFHCPTIHEYFYGTADAVYVDYEARILHGWDYKHGAGVVVEAKENPQGMYYAVGALEDLKLWDAIDMVVIHIAQPRAFHYDGPLRDWSVSTERLVAWAEDTLVPAMNRAMDSTDTTSGSHCRFCPTRGRACPQLMADMNELEMMIMLMNGTADELSNEQVSRFLGLVELAKIVGAAAEKTAFNRMQAGHAVPGYKLVKARSNRIWKEGSEADLKKALGDKAYAEPKLKSPAQIEKLPGGAALAVKYGFKPDAGLTVEKGDDARPEVSRDTKSLFTAVSKRGKTLETVA